jgi:protein TonB
VERQIFDTSTSAPARSRAITLPVSMAVHAAVVAGALILPLLGDNVLPEVAAAGPRVFFTEPAVMPPVAPPPAAPAGPVRVAKPRPVQLAGTSLLAPVAIPDTLPEEPLGGTDLGGDPNGVIGGVPDGVPIGVIVGGLPEATTIVKPIPISRGIREPRKLRHVTPTYPPIAIKAGIQGTVVVECTIDANGRVVNAAVVEGNPLLNAAAIEAVHQWVYTPTLLNGVPVPVLLRASVTFSLRH